MTEENQVESQGVGDRVKKYLRSAPKRYFITAFSGMAMGLFCTLIIGTILCQIAAIFGDNSFGKLLNHFGSIAKMLMGAGIGVGIAHALGKSKLIIYSSAVAGMIGAWSEQLLASLISGSEFALKFGLPGNPIGAYIVALLTMELVSLYAGRTKLDIILIPLGQCLLSILGLFVAVPFVWLVGVIGKGIEQATAFAPFIMGIVVSVAMGILLTMPTSSAAIWIAIASGNTSDAMLLAGGAAACGCAAHMIGFAVASFRENRFGGAIAQGLGTSMLQIPNIMRKPRIMLPEIIASAVVGPLSTCVFKLHCSATGGGMGTSGLVGVFGILETSEPSALTYIGIALLMFILPAAISFAVSELMRKRGRISYGDQALDA